MRFSNWLLSPRERLGEGTKGIWLLAGCVLVLPFLLAATGDTLSDNYERLRNLSTTEKEELRRKQQQFAKLSPQEQQRLRDLHEQIKDSDDAARLQEVALRYHEWLSTVPGKQRAELLELSTDKRLDKIKVVMQQQEADRFKELVKKTPLQPTDIRSIFSWLDGYVTKYESELINSLPKEYQSRIRQVKSEQERRRSLQMSLWRRRDGTQLPPPDDEDLAKLSGLLSKPAREALEKVPARDQKLWLVQEWVRAAIASKFSPHISEERLLAFYRKERDQLDKSKILDPSKVEKLDSLPRDAFYAELKKLYMQQQHARNYNDRFSGHGPGRGRPWFRGQRPDGRPGEGHRPDGRPHDGPRPDRPRGEGHQPDGPRGDRPHGGGPPRRDRAPE